MNADDVIIDYGTITDISEDTIYIDNTTASMYSFNIGACGSSGSFLTSSGANGTSWGSITSSSSLSALQVSGNAEFDGDVKIKGISIARTLEDIQKRLAILVPDPAKLEHFEALKKAYDHYKLLESLCELPTTETKE
jgi:hypothetical protein